ncbi:fatty acid synthase subunit alpha [Fusarium coicis]|nr:fatty acid synthase subunit alpha [Fusarium coicis]
MAKKTISAKYRELDAAFREPRLLQCYQEDASTISTKPSVVEQDVGKAALDFLAVSTLSSDPDQPAVRIAIKVEDVPIGSRDIILAMIAQKLRRPFADIDYFKSIKQLCGGRSMIENETIGDLSLVFDPLPDRAEDMQFSELSQILSGSIPVAKLMSAHIKLTASVFTYKMPGGFAIANA